MKFISLVKPGIIFGNTVTLSGGYFVGVKASGFSTFGFLAALFGMMLVIAAGCVLNNYIDRDIDCLMERTKHQPSACGLVSLKFCVKLRFLIWLIWFSFTIFGHEFYYHYDSVYWPCCLCCCLYAMV